MNILFMQSNNIPTAEEFLNNTQEGNSIWGDLLKDKGDVFYAEDVKIAMIEFAKLHVQAALEAASEKADLKDYEEYQYGGGYITKQEIDKDSILNSYPLENIK